MTGRDALVDAILAMFGGGGTTHQVTDPRITLVGGTTRMTAPVDAQHPLTADR
ncbi:hypothetical protein [Kitasatospora sp. NPDC091207]|uniref:hypothetical protein n=1 Tax=Kitasatospora sp. NPDC091207 TaxID=3364083 RepID=UPI0038229404